MKCFRCRGQMTKSDLIQGHVGRFINMQLTNTKTATEPEHVTLHIKCSKKHSLYDSNRYGAKYHKQSTDSG